MNPLLALCILLTFLPLEDTKYTKQDLNVISEEFNNRMLNDINFKNYVATMSKDFLELQAFVDGSYVPPTDIEYLDIEVDDIDDYYLEEVSSC